MAAPDRTRLTGPPRISLDGSALAHARAGALFFAGVVRFSRQERSDEGMTVMSAYRGLLPAELPVLAPLVIVGLVVWLLLRRKR